MTKKALKTITENIQNLESQIFYGIQDLKKYSDNEKIEQTITDINFYFGRLYGIQDTLTVLNITFDFDSIYARIKEQIVKNIYINSVSHILSAKYKFTAFGQFY